MKRVRIYQQIISDENLRLAIQEVNRGHRRNGDHSLNKKVMEIEAHIDEYVVKLRKFIEDLVTGDEHMHKPLQRRKWDRNADSGKGKWRDINEPLLWPDQYVHHAVVQPMIPHIRRSMDKYCIASVPGRGNSYGVKVLKKWMKNDPVGTQYCAECDIHHCFVEVDPPYVIHALKRLFKDRETLWLCDALMEYGVLIGAFFSAWFLHLLLQPLDLMIHQKQYGVSHYLRQMDNFTIFGPNKRKLRRLLEDVRAWLAEVGLRLKENWQIFRVGFTPRVEKAHDALSEKKQRHRRPRIPSALGYRFGHGYTILRKHNLFRLKRALHTYYHRRDRNRVISFKRASGLISRLGRSASATVGEYWSGITSRIPCSISRKSSEGNVGGCNDYIRLIGRSERSGTYESTGNGRSGEVYRGADPGNQPKPCAAVSKCETGRDRGVHRI